MKFFKAGWILYLAGGLFLAELLNLGVAFWALKRLEHKAGAPIEGQFLPNLLRPSFTLKEAKIDWQGDFQVLSGTFEVQYDPLFFLPGRKFRTQIKGESLSVRLGGELAESEGLTDVNVERAEADLAFARKGPPEIFFFDLRSPELQFHLSKQGEV